MRAIIKDEGLALETEKIENDPVLPPSQSRAGIINLIRQRYTKPTTPER
ncbi:MAG TPA: hypothetical protein VHX39_08925 [Acetobacteraceae bacterium]|jgi:hypothetical protein|nr:hypothetical protein [Acetobacteraceae bacterium]